MDDKRQQATKGKEGPEEEERLREGGPGTPTALNLI
jgi:hypothetical protein